MSRQNKVHGGKLWKDVAFVAVLLLCSVLFAISIYQVWKNISFEKRIDEEFQSAIQECGGTWMPLAKASAHASLIAETHGDTLLPSAGSGFNQLEEGTAGVFVLPDQNFSVPLYYVRGGDAQKLSDDKNSAALLVSGHAPVICDHDYQGFDVIKNCKEGDISYVQIGEEKIPYVCTQIDRNAFNSTKDLILSEGYSPFMLPSSMMATYTCNGSWKSVTIVLWKQIENNSANVEFVSKDGYCSTLFQANIIQ